jgi:outer membrane lipoprotein LolB
VNISKPLQHTIAARLRHTGYMYKPRVITWCGAVLAAGVLLSACVTAPVAQTDATTANVMSVRTGRISVRAPDERGAVQQWHAGFEFVEKAASRNLRLVSPLGSTVATIEADAQGARLTTADGAQSSYGSLAELTQRVTGVALPETAWRYWLQGTPAPGETSTQQETGKFVQSGFMVNVVTRFDNNNPRVLEITRADSPDLLVRVALEAGNSNP